MSSQAKYRDPNPVVQFVLRRFFERVGQALADSPPGTLLDAGCGEGELVRRGLVGSHLRAVHLDLNWDDLLEFHRLNGNRRLVRGSALGLPFGPASFDTVLCLEVLEHLEKPEQALAELVRVGRKRVIVSVPLEPWFRLGNLARGKYARRWGSFPDHRQHFSTDKLRRLLDTHLESVRIREAFPWLVATGVPRPALP